MRYGSLQKAFSVGTILLFVMFLAAIEVIGYQSCFFI